MQGIHISTGIQEATYSDFHRKLKDSEICREAWWPQASRFLSIFPNTNPGEKKNSYWLAGKKKEGTVDFSWVFDLTLW